MRNTFVTRIKKHNSRKKRSYKKKPRSRKRRSYRKKRSYRNKQRLYGGSPSRSRSPSRRLSRSRSRSRSPSPIPIRIPNPSPGSPTFEWSGKASDLPLSIQMHEFALFAHYQLGGRGITFYAQSREYMVKRFKEVYGAASVTIYTPSDIKMLKSICDGKIPMVYSSGTKLNFDVILDRYNGSIPPEYILPDSISIHDDKYVGPDGFLLLKTDKHEAAIKSFYKRVRELFCRIGTFDMINYIRSIVEEFPLPEGQSWGNLGTDLGFIKVSDALDYIVYLINRTDIVNIEDARSLRRLVEHFVNLFSDMIGDVRGCIFPGMEGIKGIDRMELVAPYMIVKLKDPNQPFTYDNTEMVVNNCYFELGHPVQFHMNIMRNPSDMIRNKLEELCPYHYEIIDWLNSLEGGRLF